VICRLQLSHGNGWREMASIADNFAFLQKRLN